MYFQIEYYVPGGRSEKLIIMNVKTPPKYYLLTISILGEERCYLGLESSGKEGEFILGNSLLKPFHLFYTFYPQKVGFAVGMNSTGSISEGSNTSHTIYIISIIFVAILYFGISKWADRR